MKRPELSDDIFIEVYDSRNLSIYRTTVKKVNACSTDLWAYCGLKAVFISRDLVIVETLALERPS